MHTKLNKIKVTNRKLVLIFSVAKLIISNNRLLCIKRHNHDRIAKNKRIETFAHKICQY
jgi:hypothetical protein